MAVTQQQDVRPYLIDVPDRVKGQPFKWHGPGDGVFIAIGAVLATAADIKYGHLAALLAFAVALFWLIPLKNGRLYAVVGVWYQSQKLLRVKRGVIWRAKPGKGNKNSPLRHLKVTVLQDLASGLSIPIIHNRLTRHDSIVIMGDGAKMVAGDIAEQTAFIKRIAQAISMATAGAPGVKTCFSFVFMRRPPNMVSLAQVVGHGLRPDVWHVPEETPGMSEDDRRRIGRLKFLNSVANASFKLMSVFGNSVTMAVVITVREAPSLARSRGQDRALHPTEAKSLPVLQIAQNVINEFAAAQVANPRMMAVDELKGFLRSGWDLNIGAYHLRAFRDPEPPEAARHWPTEEIRATRDTLVVDGSSYHAVIRLRTNRANVALPVDFRVLHAVDARWVTVAQVGTTSSSTNEARLLDRGLPIIEDARRVFGYDRERPEVRRNRERREHRREQIADAPFRVDFARLIVVSALTAAALEDEVIKVTNHARLLGLGPERITGPIWVWRYFMSAVTGLNLF